MPDDSPVEALKLAVTERKDKAISEPASLRLKGRQAHFVDAYLADPSNATAAAIVAGYSPRSAKQVSFCLLRQSRVRTAISEALAERREREAVERERLIRQHERMIYADPARLFNADGTPKSIHEIDADTRAAIASFDVEETYTEHDGQKVLTGRACKVRLVDRSAWAERLAEMLGLIGKHRIGLTINNTINVANLPSDPLQASLAYQRIMGGGNAD